MGSRPTSTTPIINSATSADADPKPVNEDLNLALIVGQLVAEPETRTLPSGSVAASFSLTVRTKGNKTTSVPAVWYDPPKRMLRWGPGEHVIASGAVVRRFFRGAGGLGSATEVVVEQAELVRHEAKTARVVARAWSTVSAMSVKG